MTPPGIVVFSGGSAANSLVDVFDGLARSHACTLSYVIPISDNGGSSSEVLRVFGGPSVGDVRSRLVRLIPSDSGSAERQAVKALFNHRLSSDGERARDEWLSIVEARSALWRHMSSSKRELIRSFLLHLHMEIIKRGRPPANTFDFQAAAVGNLFLTGARLFCGSFEAAVHLLACVAGVSEQVQVLPAINTNFTHHISAGLQDGSVIVGQNAISHPSAPTSFPERAAAPVPAAVSSSALPSALPSAMVSHDQQAGRSTPPVSETARTSDAEEEPDEEEDANLPGTLRSLRRRNIAFSKLADAPLPSPIARIWYINPYGQEMRPVANPRVIEAIRGGEGSKGQGGQGRPGPGTTQAIIYSIGSLYTSIVPSLLLRGVGAALAESRALKILLLNGSADRETAGMRASDYVAAIASAAGGLGQGAGGGLGPGLVSTPASSLSATSTAASSASAAHHGQLRREVLRAVQGRSPLGGGGRPAAHATDAAPEAEAEYRRFVTHVVHLEAPLGPSPESAGSGSGSGSVVSGSGGVRPGVDEEGGGEEGRKRTVRAEMPEVDADKLAGWGIRCVPVGVACYTGGGTGSNTTGGGGARYDTEALARVLDGLVWGRRV